MLNNKTIYFPALSAGIIGKDDLKHKFGKSFRFYNKNGIIDYNKFLITAGHNFKRDLKKEVDLNLNHTLVLGDSGGFQLASGAIKYSEEIVDKILIWLEENTNYGMNIDFPAYYFSKSKNEKPKSEEEYFNNNLEISYKNYKYFYLNKKNKTKLMNVLHGRNIIHLNKWYNKIKDFNFEGGWGIGSVKGMSIYYILLNFFFLFEKNEFNKIFDYKFLIHFLGFSRLKEMPILMYLQNKLNQLNKNVTITFDSSYPFYTATFGNYYFSVTQYGFNNLQISSKILNQKNNLNLDINLPCQCPVCNNVSYNDILKNFKQESNEGSSIFYLYIGLHNFYKMLEYKENMENIIDSNSTYLYESYFSNDILKLFKIIDNAFNNENPSKYIENVKYDIIQIEKLFDKSDDNKKEEMIQDIF